MTKRSFNLLSETEIASFRCRTPVVEGVLAYWNSLRRGQPVPFRHDVEPADIKAFLPHVFMVDLSYEPFRAKYRLVGTEIVRVARFDFTNRFADELDFQDDVGTNWSDNYRIVAEAGRPGFGISHWSVEGGSYRWIEYVLCPLLTSDGKVGQCLAAEDYEPLDVIESDSIRPVTPRSA
jgi:hypothetical protein